MANGLKAKQSVSIHAPVWGATFDPYKNVVVTGFNPRTRVGCDAWLDSKKLPVFVSIHAPVWGATSK